MNNTHSFSPNFEEEYNNADTCTMCGESFFMCDCKEDLTDWGETDED